MVTKVRNQLLKQICLHVTPDRWDKAVMIIMIMMIDKMLLNIVQSRGGEIWEHDINYLSETKLVPMLVSGRSIALKFPYTRKKINDG